MLSALSLYFSALFPYVLELYFPMIQCSISLRLWALFPYALVLYFPMFIFLFPYGLVLFNPIFIFLFLAFDFLSVLRGHSVFSSPPQRPMTSDFKGFSIQILSITFIFLF